MQLCHCHGNLGHTYGRSYKKSPHPCSNACFVSYPSFRARCSSEFFLLQTSTVFLTSFTWKALEADLFFFIRLYLKITVYPKGTRCGILTPFSLMLVIVHNYFAATATLIRHHPSPSWFLYSRQSSFAAHKTYQFCPVFIEYNLCLHCLIVFVLKHYKKMLLLSL